MKDLSNSVFGWLHSYLGTIVFIALVVAVVITWQRYGHQLRMAWAAGNGPLQHHWRRLCQRYRGPLLYYIIVYAALTAIVVAAIALKMGVNIIGLYVLISWIALSFFALLAMADANIGLTKMREGTFKYIHRGGAIQGIIFSYLDHIQITTEAAIRTNCLMTVLRVASRGRSTQWLHDQLCQTPQFQHDPALVDRWITAPADTPMTTQEADQLIGWLALPGAGRPNNLERQRLFDALQRLADYQAALDEFSIITLDELSDETRISVRDPATGTIQVFQLSPNVQRWCRESCGEPQTARPGIWGNIRVFGVPFVDQVMRVPGMIKWQVNAVTGKIEPVGVRPMVEELPLSIQTIPFKVKDSETASGPRVEADINVFLRIRNPYRFGFAIDNAVQGVILAVLDRHRTLVRLLGFEQVFRNKEQISAVIRRNVRGEAVTLKVNNPDDRNEDAQIVPESGTGEYPIAHVRRYGIAITDLAVEDIDTDASGRKLLEQVETARQESVAEDTRSVGHSAAVKREMEAVASQGERLGVEYLKLLQMKAIPPGSTVLMGGEGGEVDQKRLLAALLKLEQKGGNPDRGQDKDKDQDGTKEKKK